MNQASLIKLRHQLEEAIKSGTSETYAALRRQLAEALKQLDQALPPNPPAEDHPEPILHAIETAWYQGGEPTKKLPGDTGLEKRLDGLAKDILSVQRFAIALSQGNLSPALDAKGLMAGGLKSLQASLRHLVWQTRMIALGDFSQRVDFMGEFSESFNSMVGNLAEARDQLKLHGEEMARANADLQTEIAHRKSSETLIHNLNEQLQQKIADLVAANEDMESFSYSVSHDLRAPLRAITGFAGILISDHARQLDEEGRRLLQVITDNARFMGNLIDDLLSFSRLGRQELRKSAIDMMDLVQKIISEFRYRTPERDLRLVVQDLPPASGDPGLISQVWTNLLSNAVKFTGTRDAAIIEVSGWSQEGEAFYQVKDNGVGFDMAYAEKLFGVFQRLHRKAEFEGTGVGLALVQKIIQRHGGKVWGEGKLNEGATFSFSLPREQS